jgi:hypothetical protein
MATEPKQKAGSADDVYPDTLETEESKKKDAPSGFLIVALDKLSISQIEAFARARGVTDTKVFLEEIERADAESFTTRPQDLNQVVEFCTKENRIGTRRLEERDQNHHEAHPLSAARAREGAQLIAAASILCKEPTIQVPDGLHNDKGIPVQEILPDWNDRDQQTLLSRPTFDEAIYETVRFNHRSVREFLWTARGA